MADAITKQQTQASETSVSVAFLLFFLSDEDGTALSSDPILSQDEAFEIEFLRKFV